MLIKISRDMKSLSPHDVAGNCRMAFDAAECLGIPRVIEPRDMNLLAVPDKLAVMTYLYQLRAHFTGHQLEIEQIGNTSDESSYIIGNYKSDNLPSQNILTLDHLKRQFSQQRSINDDDERSPTDKKDMRNLILTGPKQLLGKVLSPVKEKPLSTNNKKVQVQNTCDYHSTVKNSKEYSPLIYERELTDAFAHLDAAESNSSTKTLQNNESKEQRCIRKVSPVTSPNTDTGTANVSRSDNCRKSLANIIVSIVTETAIPA